MSNQTHFETLAMGASAILADLGYHFCVAFDVHAYNRVVPSDFALPTFGRRATPGLLVGNHRGLWEPFLGALQARPDLVAAADPLDRYTEQSVAKSLEGFDVGVDVRFGHQSEPSPVAMQQLAEVAGLAKLTSAHLSVHPVYGPWIALRAALVIDLDVQIETSPAENVCDEQCVARCELAFERALRATEGRGHAAIRATWQAWLEVRDACCSGRGYRYSDDQIGYHYTHDRRYLGLDSA